MKFNSLLILSCLYLTLSDIQAEEECPRDSLYPLKLIDLIKKSDSSAECLSEARRTFKSRYDQRDFGLWISSYSGLVIDESQEFIKVFNYSLAKSLMKNFGDLINSLDIQFDRLNATLSVEFVGLVNDNCFNTLKALSLARCNGSALDELTNAFNSVESFTFSTEKLRVNSENRLNKLVPNVNHLNIEYTYSSDWAFINGAFPHLSRFQVIFPENKTPDSVRKSDITNFLKNNTRINDLTIVRTNLQLLKEAYDILPQLDRVWLRWLPKNFVGKQKEPIYFDNVKNLAIHSFLGEIPEKCMFNQVETLFLYVQVKSTRKWFEFLSNQVNKNLSQLSLFNINRDDFSAMPELFPSLQTAYITSSWYYVATRIVEFIEKSASLNYLKLVVMMGEEEMERLQETLPKGWNAQFQTSGQYEVQIILQKLDFIG